MSRSRRRVVPFVLLALAATAAVPGAASARMSIFYDEQDEGDDAAAGTDHGGS